jgi:hypothetical protein
MHRTYTRHAVDCPEAFDDAAHAALSFADDDGPNNWADHSTSKPDGSGWLIERKPLHVYHNVRRVAGILAETECVGDMADEAARACIANLPAEDDAAEEPSIAIPLSGAKLLLRTIEDVANSGGSGVDPRYAKDLRASCRDRAQGVTPRSCPRNRDGRKPDMHGPK